MPLLLVVSKAVFAAILIRECHICAAVIARQGRCGPCPLCDSLVRR